MSQVALALYNIANTLPFNDYDIDETIVKKLIKQKNEWNVQ